MNSFLDISLLLLFLLFSALFSGLESAFTSISLLKARLLYKKGKKGSKQLLKLRREPRRVITFLLIGNNISNILASVYTTSLSISYFGDLGVGIATGFLTLIILIFCEIVPKSFSTVNAQNIALLGAPFLHFFINLFSPIISLFDILTLLIIKKSKKAPVFTESEFKSIVDLAVEENFFGEEEKKFIKNLVDFSEYTVEDIMTPKEKIVTISSNMSVKRALLSVKKYRYMRFPVEKKRTGEIIGVVHLRDLITNVKGNSKIKVIDIARNIQLIPKDYPISKLFNEFRKTKTHIAMVVDSNKKIVGLVTFEDLIEEIFGEIYDETEIPMKVEVKYQNSKMIVQGSANVSVRMINDILKSNIPEEEDYKTINGLLRRKITGRIKKGQQISINDVKITVLEKADAGNINVRIEKK